MGVPVLGKNCKLYRNTGSYGSPVWNEVDNVRDLKLANPKGEADVTRRASGNFEESEPTQAKVSVEFEMVWDPADADLVAIRDGYLAHTLMEFLILDGGSAVAGSQGLRAHFKFHEFSRDEGLRDAAMVSVSMKPAYNANAIPAWYTVP